LSAFDRQTQHPLGSAPHLDFEMWESRNPTHRSLLSAKAPCPILFRA
jgi:hypothetical protein